MQTAAIPWRVVVPVPAPRVEFWNSNFLDNFAALDTSHNAPTLLLQGVLSAGILGVTLWLLRKQRVALVLFGTITLGCLSFFYLKKVGYIRHHGHVFLAWIGAAWLVFAPQNSAILGDRERRNWTTLLVLVLGAQLVGSIAACAADLRGRFSAGDAVSEWIVARGYQDRVLVAPADIAALLQREVYLPFNDRFGTFLYYRRPWHRLKPADLAPLAKQLERERGKRCLLIIPADVFDWTLPGFRVEGCRELARWDDCFMQTGKMIAFELSDSD
jgi:hypothetical protein